MNTNLSPNVPSLVPAPSDRHVQVAAALLRFNLALVFLGHALTKILVYTLPGTAAFFEAHGFPGWTAPIVVVAELAAGLALASGVVVRVASLATLPIMAGAIATHVPNGWMFTQPNGGWEFPALVTVLVLVQALLGPGAFALGPVFSRRRTVRRVGAAGLARA